MLHFKKILLLFISLVPVHGFAADCEVEAQLKGVQIQNCDGQHYLGYVGEDGSLINSSEFDAIPLGIETFLSDLCKCYLWQVSGIAGAHTHIARFYQEDSKGMLILIPGGEFGSEIGKISRISQSSGFTVEVRDSDVSGKSKTWERYRFDGNKFVKIKTPKH
jgi:hypothetical protein